jgi:hypothetical protein
MTHVIVYDDPYMNRNLMILSFSTYQYIVNLWKNSHRKLALLQMYWVRQTAACDGEGPPYSVRQAGLKG